MYRTLNPKSTCYFIILKKKLSRYKFFFSQLDDSEAWITDSSDRKSGSGFDIVVHRLVDHSDLPSETIFGCVLTIPGTSYEVREESIYRHRGGRKFDFPSYVVP